jgi:beta-lysine 5,6-aminomutase alpha subunit
VLEEALCFLEQVERVGLFDAIAAGMFAEVKRPPDGGKGLEGVVAKTKEYWNPFEQFLCSRLGVTA